ncbi:S100P-binding protein isoform X2 [Oryzias latipes]|uniref:S100P-binding protein n=1 Tax=Oryzias latipes TaxID=8090 RepID=A0A3B3HWE0_ORYLA|nr:S100P-binding protein isoform X2 [Oryzias latipes]
MEKYLQSNSLIPPPDEHLKPLSVCSRTVTCNQKGGPLPPKPRQFNHLQIKVQLENNLAKKRKLDDCGVDPDYRSPKIKAISPNAFSPDLGCFMDYSSPAGWDSMSTCTPSPPELYEKTQAPVRDLREVLDSPLHVKHVDLRCTLDSKSLSLASDFDNDVDDIFCLNPLSQDEQKKLLPVSSNVADEGCPAETESEQQLHQEAQLCPQRLSFLDDDLRESLSQPLAEPVTSTVTCLEEAVQEGLDIGAPRFESSVCEGSPAAEHRNLVSKVQEDSFFVDDFSATGDSLWETTLPLQVQVKSKVVVPNKLTSQPSSTLKDSYGRLNRPKVYSRKSEWEHQSRQYVYSVTSHMMENQGTTRVMTELLDLMTSVSGQSGAHGARWQHPADLTCRNYQRRFNKDTPLMSLCDWQRKNQLTYKRFFKIPKIFKRCSTEH